MGGGRHGGRGRDARIKGGRDKERKEERGREEGREGSGRGLKKERVEASV